MLTTILVGLTVLLSSVGIVVAVSSYVWSREYPKVRITKEIPEHAYLPDLEIDVKDGKPYWVERMECTYVQHLKNCGLIYPAIFAATTYGLWHFVGEKLL